MLNETDSRRLLNLLRARMDADGFGALDTHAMTLLTREADDDMPPVDHATVLLHYIKTVTPLLQSIGAARIEQARKTLGDMFGVGNSLSIELDVAGLDAFLETGAQDSVELAGFPEADELVQVLQELGQRIQAYEYRAPSDDPGSDEPPGGGGLTP